MFIEEAARLESSNGLLLLLLLGCDDSILVNGVVVAMVDVSTSFVGMESLVGEIGDGSSCCVDLDSVSSILFCVDLCKNNTVQRRCVYVTWQLFSRKNVLRSGN